MKIEYNTERFEIDTKRCYLPIHIIDTCPHCGLSVTKDLEEDYLSYPKLNIPFEINMHHVIEHDEGIADEEHDWKIKVILRVTMEAA